MASPQLWTLAEEIIFDDKELFKSGPTTFSHLPGSMPAQAVFLGQFASDFYICKDIAEEDTYFRDVVVHRLGFLRRLTHTNVTKFYGLARVSSRERSSTKIYYRVASEYFSGGDLNTWTLESRQTRENNTIPHGQIKQILRDTLTGLNYLHSCSAKIGIIHCDIKPENLVFRCFKKEQVVIIDLDGAIIGSRTVPIEGKTGVCTPRYAAPELLLCTAREMDPESAISGKIDIWSVGCVAIELCTGEKPKVYAQGSSWECTAPQHFMFHVACGKVKPKIPPLDANDTDKLLKSFIMSCLCREIEQRKSAAELLKDAYLCGHQQLPSVA